MSTNDWVNSIRDMYAEGASDAEVAAYMKVPLRKFYEHMEKNAAFNELVVFGRTLSQAWWESQARHNVKNKSFNTPLWTFYMKNKHGWADKVDTTNSNENVNTDLDTLRQKVFKEVAALTKQMQPELTDAKVLFELPVEDEHEPE